MTPHPLTPLRRGPDPSNVDDDGGHLLPWGEVGSGSAESRVRG